jgi:Tfp pilus assembly protein PilF
MYRFICLLICFFLYCSSGFAAQELNIAELNRLINEGNYSEPLKQITNYLNNYYSQNPQNAVIPSQFTSINYLGKLDQLNQLLYPKSITRSTPTAPDSNLDRINRLNRPIEKKKVSNFYLPENEQLAQIHKLAAMAHDGLKNYNAALNNFVQALRYSQPGKSTDYEIFYKIAQVYRKMGLPQAYYDFMYSAIIFNPDKIEYNLELGQALARTPNIENAIYYLERYINLSNGNVAPEIFSLLGRLCENLGRNPDAQNYYMQYLKERPDDAEVLFALACLAFKKTGNFKLAFESFSKALSQLPETDIFRRAKSFEYQGDMAMRDLNFEDAISFYMQTIEYQNLLRNKIDDDKKKSDELDAQIRALRIQIINEQSFENVRRLNELNETRGQLDIDLRDLRFQFSRLAPGKVRWNLATALKLTDQLERSIQYFRECIFFDYKTFEARENISKIQLKIRRGY